MCRYCETNIGSYYDSDSIIYKKDRFGLNNLITILAITGENNKPKIMVDVCLEDSFKSIINYTANINYCPVCGEKLINEKTNIDTRY